jgi:hypothetical protein
MFSVDIKDMIKKHWKTSFAFNITPILGSIKPIRQDPVTQFYLKIRNNIESGCNDFDIEYICDIIVIKSLNITELVF